jgi:hypothetical protein
VSVEPAHRPAVRPVDASECPAGTPGHPVPDGGRWEPPEHRVCRRRTDREETAVAVLTLPTYDPRLPAHDRAGLFWGVPSADPATVREREVAEFAAAVKVLADPGDHPADGSLTR